MTRLPRVRELMPGLFLLETELDDFDVRSVVIVGSTGAVVWDTLAHPAQMSVVRDLVSGVPLSVVYSHADWDHVWGAAGVPVPLEVVAHELAGARFVADVPAKLEEKRASQPGVWDDVELVTPTRLFRGTLSIDLGGATLELHHLPGHTPDSVVAWIPEWGTWLAADAVETPLPVVNEGGAVPAWVDELTRWASLDGLTSVIPSHGRLGGRELMEDNISYLQSLMRGVDAPPGNAMQPFYRDTHNRNVRAMLGYRG